MIPEEAPPSQPTDSGDILRDIFAFLSYLNCHDITPRCGRWLTPRQIRPLNQRFTLPEDVSQVRGEKQTVRLRFLHYLAERIELVALAGPYLKPTPAALDWLTLERTAQLRTLWDAWTEESPENAVLWVRYQLPAWQESEPIALFHRVLAHLRHCPPGRWFSITSFTNTVLDLDVDLQAITPAWEPEPGETPYDVVCFLCDLLTRYLPWMGLVALAGGNREPTAFQITPLGEMLLDLSPFREVSAPPKPARLTLDPNLTIEVPPDFHLALLYRLEPWVKWLALGRYRLTQASFTRALGRGGVVEELLFTLEQGTGAPLPAHVLETVQAWATESKRLIIRRLTFLQAKDPELLTYLAGIRGLRHHFLETISPRHVVLDAQTLESLVRKLQARGYHPLVTFPLKPTGERPASGRPWGPSGAAHLLLAVRIYNQLARFIEPFGHIPASLLEELEAQLSSRQLEIVEQAVQRTIERLSDAIEGWTPHPPYAPAAPVKDTIALIEQALAEGKDLEMEYYTAGRGELTHRRVKPLRFEWRGESPYLVAFCYLRRAVRIFRLNRIKSLRIIPPPNSNA